MTIDRYILSQWMLAFLAALAVSVGLLLLGDVYDYLPDLLAAKASAGQILSYYATLIPTFAPKVIPLGALLSILFSLGTLHKNCEITALRAAGCSLFRMTRTLWLAIAALCVGLFYLNVSLVPWCVERAQRIKSHIEEFHQLESAQVPLYKVTPTFTFANPSQKRLWIMDGFCERTYQCYGVNVYECDEVGKETARLSAQEGYYDDQAGHWVFINGRELFFDTESASPIRLLSFSKKSMPQWTESPYLMKLMSKPANTLSLAQLATILGALPLGDPAALPFSMRYQSMLASPLLALIAACLAIPFAVLGVRTHPMVGIAKCIGIFILYIFAADICALLGRTGSADPLVATWFPIIGLLVFCGFLYKRAR